MTGLLYLAALLDLDDRYMDADPDDRHAVVLEVIAGERCVHGFPDQGEGCATCSAPVAA